jgi:hypothetical protein
MCLLCKADVDISEMSQHLKTEHTQSCSVTVPFVGKWQDLEQLQKRRRHAGSVDSGDLDLLSDDPDVPLESSETEMAPKRFKTDIE